MKKACWGGRLSYLLSINKPGCQCLNLIQFVTIGPRWTASAKSVIDIEV